MSIKATTDLVEVWRVAPGMQQMRVVEQCQFLKHLKKKKRSARKCDSLMLQFFPKAGRISFKKACFGEDVGMLLPQAMKLSPSKHTPLPETEKCPGCCRIRDVRPVSSRWKMTRPLIKTSFTVPGEDCKLQEKSIDTKNVGAAGRRAWHNL